MEFSFQLGSLDNPFLKMHASMKELGLNETKDSSAEKLMTQEERDMAYFERRYQERVSIDSFFLSN